MAAISTLNSHVKRTLEFFYKDDIYFCIGKSSPWEDEDDPSINDDNPPAPEFEVEDVSEIIGFKKAEEVYLVVPDEEGEISYQNSRWRVIPPDEVYQHKCRHVFLSTTIRYDELPLGRYRQIGVYTGTKPAKGVAPGKYNLLPSEVEDNGTLEVLDNRQDNSRQADQKEVLSLIIKM